MIVTRVNLKHIVTIWIQKHWTTCVLRASSSMQCLQILRYTSTFNNPLKPESGQGRCVTATCVHIHGSVHNSPVLCTIDTMSLQDTRQHMVINCNRGEEHSNWEALAVIASLHLKDRCNWSFHFQEEECRRRRREIIGKENIWSREKKNREPYMQKAGDSWDISRNFFWIFRKILDWEREISTAPKPSPEVAPSKMEVAPS